VVLVPVPVRSSRVCGVCVGAGVGAALDWVCWLVVLSGAAGVLVVLVVLLLLVMAAIMINIRMRPPAIKSILPRDFFGLVWVGNGCEGCCESIVKTSLDGLIVAWCG
jgi:hypothetical protein